MDSKIKKQISLGVMALIALNALALSILSLSRSGKNLKELKQQISELQKQEDLLINQKTIRKDHKIYEQWLAERQRSTVQAKNAQAAFQAIQKQLVQMIQSDGQNVFISAKMLDAPKQSGRVHQGLTSVDFICSWTFLLKFLNQLEFADNSLSLSEISIKNIEPRGLRCQVKIHYPYKLS